MPKGTEHFRITPSPCHDDDAMDRLVHALGEVWWSRLDLQPTA